VLGEVDAAAGVVRPFRNMPAKVPIAGSRRKRSPPSGRRFMSAGSAVEVFRELGVHALGQPVKEGAAPLALTERQRCRGEASTVCRNSRPGRPSAGARPMSAPDSCSMKSR